MEENIEKTVDEKCTGKKMVEQLCRWLRRIANATLSVFWFMFYCEAGLLICAYIAEVHGHEINECAYGTIFVISVTAMLVVMGVKAYKCFQFGGDEVPALSLMLIGSSIGSFVGCLFLYWAGTTFVNFTLNCATSAACIITSTAISFADSIIGFL